MSTIPYFTRYTRSVGTGDSAQILLDDSSPENVNAMVDVVQAALDAEGLAVASVFTIERLRRITGGFFDVIVYLLLAMGILIASVGALGLMGTMSTNVLERTREIGVMRAIGASDGAVQRIVIVEGVFIGLISWANRRGAGLPGGRSVEQRRGHGALPDATALHLLGLRRDHLVRGRHRAGRHRQLPAGRRRIEADRARGAGVRVVDGVSRGLPMSVFCRNTASRAENP